MFWVLFARRQTGGRVLAQRLHTRLPPPANPHSSNLLSRSILIVKVIVRTVREGQPDDVREDDDDGSDGD